MNYGILVYDYWQERYDIQFSTEEFYGGLHCGDQFKILVNNRWISARIEKGKEWYLVGVNASALNGLAVCLKE